MQGFWRSGLWGVIALLLLSAIALRLCVRPDRSAVQLQKKTAIAEADATTSSETQPVTSGAAPAATPAAPVGAEKTPPAVRGHDRFASDEVLATKWLAERDTARALRAQRVRVVRLAAEPERLARVVDHLVRDAAGDGWRIARQESMLADAVTVAVPGGATAGLVRDRLRAAGFSPADGSPADAVVQVHLAAATLDAVPDAIAAVSAALADTTVEPDYLYFPGTTAPNDYSASTLWGLAKISAPASWDVSTGSADVVVAVIDSGMATTHPDLAANLWTNPGEMAGDSIDNDGNGYADDVNGWDFADSTAAVTDRHGHGTHVAGTIGAVGNNAVGVVGLNWSVGLLPLRVGDSSFSDSALTNALRYVNALKLNGVNIVAINASWGGEAVSLAFRNQVATANARGILLIAAAGNDGANNDSTAVYPAGLSYANIVAVAATTSSDALPSWSNYGATTVDLAAPGNGIYSTYPTSLVSSGYATLSGTSMATPHVTGAAALLAAVDASLSAAEIRARLLATVDTVSALSGKVVTGGRLNLRRAVDYRGPSVSSVTAPSGGTYGVGAVLQFTVTFDQAAVVSTTGGTPSLALTVGSTTRAAAYASGSGTSSLVFSYAVQSGDTDADGIAVGALALNGGAIADLDGDGATSAELTFAAPATSGIHVDTTAPVISSATMAATDYRTSFSYTITATDASAVTFAATGLPDGLSLASASGVISGEPLAAGTFPVSLFATDAAGNTGATTLVLTVVPVPLTVTGTLAASKTYDGTAAATLDLTAAALSGVLANDDVGLDASGAVGAFASPSVGVGKAVTISGLALSGTAAGDYTLVAPIATAGITAKSLTATGITAEDKVYDSTTAATIDVSQATLVGVVSGDHVVLDVTEAVGTFATADAAPDKIVTISGVVLSGSSAFNYSLVPPATTASILAGSIALSGLEQTYDGTPRSVTVTTMPEDMDVVVTYNGDSTAPTYAGSYAVVASAGEGDTATTVTGTLVIAPAELSVTGISVAGKTYDGTTTATLQLGGAVLDGVISGDTVALDVSGTTATFADANAGANKPVTISGLALAGVSADNYTLAAVATTADIVPATATITLSNLEQVYDGATRRPTTTTLPSGVTVELMYDGLVEAPSAAGSYAVEATVVDSNYTGSTTGTFTIEKASQTIAFTLPSTATVGMPITLSATASSGFAVTYAVVSGDAAISGSALTIGSAATSVTVRAAQAGDGNYTAAVVEGMIAANAITKRSQTITFAQLASRLTTDAPFTLAASASSSLPVSFTLVSGPASLSGATVTLTGVSGTVVITASQPGNDAYAAAASVTRSFAVGAVAPPVFFGTTASGDTVAACIDGAATRGTLLGCITAVARGFVIDFTIDEAGVITGAATTDATGAAEGSVGSLSAAATIETLTLSGTVANGVMEGTIAELGVTFTARMQSQSGPTAASAGYYVAAATETVTGVIHAVVGTDSSVYALAILAEQVTAGRGRLAAEGDFTIETADGAILSGLIDAESARISGTVTLTDASVLAFAGTHSDTAQTDRLINLSSRGPVTTVGEQVMIAGFVITGDVAKTVLLRAIGPTLADFGVTAVLEDPRLQLYDSTGRILLANDDWAGTATANTAATVGAFELPPGSRDAATVTTLAPGAYTMHVLGNGGSGVALVEVYDASDADVAQRLVNISTRGYVAGGEGVLIGGFVISGNVPKRVLVRGVGPGLSAYGVSGVLADPQLTLYRGGTAIATNDDWGIPVAVGPSQTAATAEEIATAGGAIGAFSLVEGSTDAVLMVTLAPGTYTVHLAGVSGATGVALVEVYEIPD